jgi:hypothetical protein
MNGDAPDIATYISYPGDIWHDWNYRDANRWNTSGTGAGWNLIDGIGFAQKHNKPMALSETGANGNNAPQNDGLFWQWEANMIAQAKMVGVRFLYETIWDDYDYQFLPGAGWDPTANGAKAYQLASLRKYFGRNSGGSTNLILALSEDKASNGTDATFSATIDGSPIPLPELGADTPVVIFHASGQSEAYTYSGNWASNATHNVCVTYTNPLAGGALYFNAAEFGGFGKGAQFAPLLKITDSAQHCITVGGLDSSAPNKVINYFINQLSDGGQLGFSQGVYNTSPGSGPPTSTYQGTWYGVDVVFQPSGNGSASCATQSLFGTTVPATVDTASNNASYALGIRFMSTTAAGRINAIKFYKAAANTGPHTVELWGPDGTLLGSGTSSNEPASGWVTVPLTTPIAITPNQLYTADYTLTTGHFSATNPGFPADVQSGSLLAPKYQPREAYLPGSPQYAE